MRLKDGFQACPNCGGSGCYWCRKKGWRAQCPVCCNSEPELLVKDEEGNLSCLACNSEFEKSGHLIPAEPKEKPKERPRVAPKPTAKPPIKPR